MDRGLGRILTKVKVRHPLFTVSSTLVHEFPTTPLSMSSANTFSNALMTGPIYPLNANPVLRIPLLPPLLHPKSPSILHPAGGHRSLTRAESDSDKWCCQFGKGYTQSQGPHTPLLRPPLRCPLSYAEHLGPFFPPRRSLTRARIGLQNDVVPCAKV